MTVSLAGVKRLTVCKGEVLTHDWRICYFTQNIAEVAKGMPNTGRAAKGVAKPRGAARKGFKTAEEKEAEHKRMCDMLRQ